MVEEKMIKTFYLMRHGQTRFNVQGRIQGVCDSPLTEERIEQAKAARRYFEQKGLLSRVSIRQRKRELVTLLN
jgi:broad specificity phosphatase PhoE